MVYNNFRVILIVRVVVLILTIFLFVDLFYGDSYTLTKVLVIGLLGYEVYALIAFLDKTNRELAGFLNSIKYDDFSNTYTTRKTGSSQDVLYKEFNNVIRKFREIRAEKEAQYQYLRTIVHHVGIGILTFDQDGEVQIINASAKNLLGIDIIRNIKQLKDVSPHLVDSLMELKTGGRDLIKIGKGGEEIQLSIYAIELVRMDKEFKLISIQNIKSELDEKEMEAWQNLIRVLTHEIMNSVTPISSLAATVESELETQLQNDMDTTKMSNEEVSDLHMAVQTIHKRSEGLIKFVSDFRNLTRIPMPKPEDIGVHDLLSHILNLLKFDMDAGSVCLDFKVEPFDLKIHADQEQIEQVLINLIKNAIQALQEEDEMNREKHLKIGAGIDGDDKVFITIADNGPGIEEEALKKIFIPFFTTKKSGSGIGLSLSKQIMRKHHGTISVKSELNAGTEFTLRFNQ